MPLSALSVYLIKGGTEVDSPFLHLISFEVTVIHPDTLWNKDFNLYFKKYIDYY